MLNFKYSPISNIHLSLPHPTEGEVYVTKETYNYHHYCCDGFNDIGWGCAYRTLQSISSMLQLKTKLNVDVPSIRQIQEILVRIGDKEESFIGSREWIGGAETCFVIDDLFQIPCYLHHITSSQKVSSKRNEIVDYFKTHCGLIAMGGDQDAGSKLIAGVHLSVGGEMSLLVVDPHSNGIPKGATELVNRGYVKWQHEDEFVAGSFYNLCMPKIS